MILFSQNLSAQKTNKSPKFIDGIQIQTKGGSSSKTISGRNAFNPSVLKTESCGKLEFKYAQLLDLEVEKIASRPILDYFERWVNENGLNDTYRASRVNQYGFAGVVMQDVFQVEVPDDMTKQMSVFNKVSPSELQLGDLVFFGKKDKPEHTGIYLADGYFADVDDQYALKVRKMDEKYYRKRFMAGFRP